MIKNKKVAVYGLGVEGVATVNLLAKCNRVTVFDDRKRSEIDNNFLQLVKTKNVKYSFADSTAGSQDFDFVIRSSGIRPGHLKIANLQKRGAIVTTATKIFFDECPAKIIGVTGTKGKGTTSTLIYEFLKNSDKSVFLAGNIGTPMLEILPEVKKESLVVLELSSFQLTGLHKSPHIAVVLMTTSEHLDWHADNDDYLNAKKQIVSFQKEDDFSVINEDFPNSLSFAKATHAKKYFISTQTQTNGVYLKNELIISNVRGYEQIGSTKNVLLPGRHNLQNICASVCVAKILNLENNIIKKVITTFKGLSHRLELVGFVDGVKFYNDSFSTTPETTIAAINAFTQPKILILGGSSKNSDFSELAKKISYDQTIKKVILIGKEADKIKKAILKLKLNTPIIDQKPKTMSEIFDLALQESRSGDIILLSPACASFDMFTNYKDRGDQFREGVKKLAKRS